MKKCILILIFLPVFSQSLWSQLANWNEASKTDFPINLGFQPNGFCRIAQLKFHPSNPDKYYAITPQGGLFTSVDGGENWKVAPGTDALTYSCASICIDRTNDQILYLGTGDPNLGGNSAGVYKSTDGGATFTPTTLSSGSVIEIIQHPTDPNTFVAATSKGIYKSTNNGSTWTQVTDETVYFSDMKQNAAPNSLILYAGTGEVAARFYRSTDFGSTWTQITSGIVAPTFFPQAGSRIAVTPADPEIVYFEEVGGGGMVFKSTDSGLNFTMQKAAGAPYLTLYENTMTSSGQGNYNNTLCVDATDPAKVWVQSQSTWFSSDSGVNWTRLCHWGRNIHTDHHHLVQSPYDANKLYSCNDGGIWLSLDGGLTWTPKSNGLYAYEIVVGKSSHTDKDLVSIGTQDNGRLYRNAGAWYSAMINDDFEEREFDYLPNGGYFYNLDHNTRTKAPNANPTTYGIPTATVQAMGFNRTNPELGFMGFNNIYSTTDLSSATPSWTLISNFNRIVRLIHSCIADPNRLYVIADNYIYVCSNALSDHTFTAYPLPKSGYVSGIAAVCNNANTVYVSIDNEVYRSTDGGHTWPQNVTYNLPNVTHRKLLAEEFGGTEELVFVATNNAVYYKKAADTTWTNYSTNLPARKGPTDFSMFDDGTNNAKIRYATYGRGIWETGFDNLRVPKAAFAADHTTNLCLTGGVVNFTDLSLGGATGWSWSFPGGTPSSSTEQNPSVTYTSPGTYDVTLTVTTPSGNVTVTKTNYITGPATVAGGTYNVGPGGNFTSITAAVNYWNSNCINGPVTFNLTGTTYNTASGEIFPITINPNNANSSLLIKPVGNAAITGSSMTALIFLNGVDRVTIDGSTGNTPNTICPPSSASRNLTISNTNNNLTTAVIWLQSNGTDGATDNTVKNCNLIGNASTSTLVGIGSGSSTISMSSFGIGNHRNSIINNSVQKSQYGIYSGGQITTNKNTGTVINQNALNSSGVNSILRTGILVKFEDNIQISGNTIGNINPVNNSNNPGAHGIACGRESNVTTGTGEVSGASITHNIIDNIIQGGTSAGATGILIGPVNSTTGSGPNVVANNFITRINAPSALAAYSAVGIFEGGGISSSTMIYNNTIHLTGITSDNIRTYSILINSGGNDAITYIKNNIIINQMTSSNTNHVIRVNYPLPYLRLFSDHNNFYTGGGNFASATFGDMNTFNSWQTITGVDANSKNILPEYISSTDLHLTPGGANNIAHVFGFGMPLASVSDDIDCDARHATHPAIGADENCAAPTLPTLSATAATICPGISTTLSITTGTFNSATDWKWYSGACGATPAGTGNSITVAPVTTTTYYVRGEGRCVSDGNCASITVLVNAPAINLTGPTSVCSGGNVTLDAGGNFSGYAWSDAGGSNQSATYSNLTTTATYTVTVTESTGCTATATTTVVVNTPAVVTSPSNSSVCISAPAFSLTGGSPTGGTYNGPGVNGGMFDPATAGIGVHTITYSYTDGNNCTGSGTFTLTVYALPVVSCPGNSAVCVNVPAFSLTGVSPAGGAYSGAGVSAGMFNPVTAGTGAHTITYAYSNANACANSCSFTITVHPLPTVTCPANAAVCIDAPAFALTGGSPAGGAYSGADVSAGMFDPATAGTGTHTIVYDYTNASACANSCSYTITVNPLPTVTCPANSSVCINAPVLALTGGIPAGGIYSGSGVNAGMFDPATAGIGTYTIAYDYSDANTCSNACSYTVTVNPLPTVTCSANTSVCIDAPAFTLTGSSPTDGAYSGIGVSAGMFDPSTAGIGIHTITYSFSDANACSDDCSYTIAVNALPAVVCAGSSSVCIDAAAFTLTGSSPAGGLYSGTGVNAGLFHPASAGTGVHTVSYIYSDANACANTCNYMITVNALPVVTCSGNSSVNINDPVFALYGSSPAGGVYSGSGVDAGIFDPIAAGLGTHTITYSYSDANACADMCSYTITVSTLPTVNCAGSAAVCINTPALVLTEGSPAGGTYSGPGVSAGMFDPNAAGIGVHTITYTNGGTCSFSITVNALPTVTCPANSAVHINTPAFVLTGSAPAGGTFTGAGVNAGTFDPALAGAGVQTITYTFTDAHDCTNACAYLIAVDSLSSIRDVRTRKLSMSVAPNPTSDLTEIYVFVPAAIEAQLTVTNSLGQQVMLQPIRLLAGENRFELHLEALPSGIYQVRIAAGAMSGVVNVGKQ